MSPREGVSRSGLIRRPPTPKIPPATPHDPVKSNLQAMKTRHLHLGPMTGRAMKTPVHHEGVEILTSHDPLHDAARYLLEHGIADPGDTIQTWRGVTPCMSGVAGRLAEWVVVETDKDGLKMRKWSDVQAERARLAALPRRSRTEGGFPPMGFVVDGDFLPTGTVMLPFATEAPHAA